MKLPKDCRNIEEIRENIDEIDYNIMKLFSERNDFVNEIVKFKTDEASIVAENRQKELIAKRRNWASELGLNPDLFDEMFWLLINFNVKKEMAMFRRKDQVNH